MKIGLCTGFENLELTQNLGFDYIECAVSAIAALSDEEFAQAETLVNASSIKVERANVLFPRTIKLLGPEKDQQLIDDYLEKAFARAGALGAQVVVFGSGAARAIPTEVPFRQGYRELITATKRMGEIAGNHRLTLSIEPLNREESNCINSVKEGAMLEFKFDTQLLIEGTGLSEEDIFQHIAQEIEGDSLLAVGDEELIKVHYHTNTPWKVLEYCCTLGEIYDVVIENMERQENGLQG
jgi:hypothetical protein